jgi:hypothetical protein
MTTQTQREELSQFQTQEQRARSPAAKESLFSLDLNPAMARIQQLADMGVYQSAYYHLPHPTQRFEVITMHGCVPELAYDLSDHDIPDEAIRPFQNSAMNYFKDALQLFEGYKIFGPNGPDLYFQTAISERLEEVNYIVPDFSAVPKVSDYVGFNDKVHDEVHFMICRGSEKLFDLREDRDRTTNLEGRVIYNPMSQVFHQFYIPQSEVYGNMLKDTLDELFMRYERNVLGIDEGRL